MKFATEADRLAHPQARLIPIGAWRSIDFFSDSLSDELLTIMQAPDEGLASLMQKIGHNTSRDRARTWIAIGVSHPHLSSDALINFYKQLSMSNNEAFNAASVLGRPDVMRRIVEKAPNELCKMIEAFDYEVFRYAAENGHIDVMRYLEKIAPDELHKMIKARDYDAFRMAAGNGHIDILRHFEEIVRIPEDSNT